MTTENPFLWLIMEILFIYRWIIIVMIVMSWLLAFNVINSSNNYVRQVAYALRRLTEPLLGPIRRLLPDLGGIDISPIVLILAILFIEQLVPWLFGYRTWLL